MAAFWVASDYRATFARAHDRSERSRYLTTAPRRRPSPGEILSPRTQGLILARPESIAQQYPGLVLNWEEVITACLVTSNPSTRERRSVAPLRKSGLHGLQSSIASPPSHS